MSVAFLLTYASSVTVDRTMVRPTPVCRRQADPLMVQKLWTAINFVRSQKQVANSERIERYMQREYNIAQDEVERQLNFAVVDRLVSVYRAVANKGNNPGAEQDGYRIQAADENEVSRFALNCVCVLMSSSSSLSCSFIQVIRCNNHPNEY